MAVGASALVIAGATTIIVLSLRDAADQKSIAQPPPTSTSAAAALPPAPTVSTPVPPKLQAADAEFIAELKSYGVPVSGEDPQFDINMANAICALVHEQPTKYPPGTSTILQFVTGVMGNNPSWSRQQATRFVNASASHYCPEASGPGQDEIASMPPDARFLAILQDRYGMTPTGGGQSAIRAAPSICAWKSEGWTNDQVMEAITGNNTPDTERAIVETAVSVYCPEYS
ncbi:MAG: DUF732 domain-containing protein [Mycolicibacterium sp.]